MPVTETDIDDSLSEDELLRLVYVELRHLAARKLAKESRTQTLDATALVHEAYLRLIPQNSERTGELAGWNSRAHFFAAAAEAMRRILVEKARRRARIKHGREWRRIVLTDVADVVGDAQLLALDDALTSLKAEDSLAARIVELHHFAGLSHDLVAEVLGITVYQARQKWTYARAWLRDALEN
jgi:RNA polymerase sigma factor (TIGR02999 family)